MHGGPPDSNAEADADRALVAAAAAGDRDAFNELVRRHQSAVVGLVGALAADRSEAEDLAQEVFVRAWKGLRTFRGESAFRTWLHRIALNVVQTSRAKHGRLLRVFRQTLPADPEPAAKHESADARLARRQIVSRALASLPDDLRIAVTLRDLQGLEYREIADLVGVPIGTVESRIFRARQRLRPLLAPLVERDDLR